MLPHCRPRFFMSAHPSTSLTLMLHSTVEDTATTFEEIEHKFGKRVRHILHDCSR